MIQWKTEKYTLKEIQTDILRMRAGHIVRVYNNMGIKIRYTQQPCIVDELQAASRVELIIIMFCG